MSPPSVVKDADTPLVPQVDKEGNACFETFPDFWKDYETKTFVNFRPRRTDCCCSDSMSVSFEDSDRVDPICFPPVNVSQRLIVPGDQHTYLHADGV